MKTKDKITENSAEAFNNAATVGLDPEKLIELFRKFEKKQARTRRLVAGLNIFLFISYTALASGQTGKTASGYLLCGLGFILGAAYLYFRYRPLPDSAYTLPIIDFLGKTEKRLRYFTGVDYIILIPILTLIGIGAGLIFTGRLSQYSGREGLLTMIWIIFFVGLCLFGYFAGRKKWLKENSDIHNAVKETLNCIKGDSSL
ncbi:MAG: hypothetical protein AB9888_05425 [Bacteroidales bacterium]